METRNKPIGFFDSGVGGLSVLKESMKLMPEEDYIYYGDSKNAPYGVKTVEEIRSLTFKAVEFLLEKGAKAIVVACNTATSAAVSKLREKYPDTPIIGIEPAVKPAIQLNRDGAIIIMATPMTLEQSKFLYLINKYDLKHQVVPMPCAGLVEFIERGILSGEEIEEYLKEKFLPYNNVEISSIVLGCTHYPFVKDAVKKVVNKEVLIIDGGEGTVRELKRRLIEKGITSNRIEKGKVEIYNSLNKDEILELSKKLIES